MPLDLDIVCAGGTVQVDSALLKAASRSAAFVEMVEMAMTGNSDDQAQPKQLAVKDDGQAAWETLWACLQYEPGVGTLPGLKWAGLFNLLTLVDKYALGNVTPTIELSIIHLVQQAMEARRWDRYYSSAVPVMARADSYGWLSITSTFDADMRLLALLNKLKMIGSYNTIFDYWTKPLHEVVELKQLSSILSNLPLRLSKQRDFHRLAFDLLSCVCEITSKLSK